MEPTLVPAEPGFRRRGIDVMQMLMALGALAGIAISLPVRALQWRHAALVARSTWAHAPMPLRDARCRREHVRSTEPA
jgi:hypothetical protein